ncbi:MAG: hypothetical protein V4490_04230 [Pseudomonadota bacterium]
MFKKLKGVVAKIAAGGKSKMTGDGLSQATKAMDDRAVQKQLNAIETAGTVDEKNMLANQYADDAVFGKTFGVAYAAINPQWAMEYLASRLENDGLRPKEGYDEKTLNAIREAATKKLIEQGVVIKQEPAPAEPVVSASVQPLVSAHWTAPQHKKEPTGDEEELDGTVDALTLITPSKKETIELVPPSSSIPEADIYAAPQDQDAPPVQPVPAAAAQAQSAAENKPLTFDDYIAKMKDNIRASIGANNPVTKALATALATVVAFLARTIGRPLTNYMLNKANKASAPNAAEPVEAVVPHGAAEAADKGKEHAPVVHSRLAPHAKAPAPLPKGLPGVRPPVDTGHVYATPKPNKE